MLRRGGSADAAAAATGVGVAGCHTRGEVIYRPGVRPDDIAFGASAFSVPSGRSAVRVTWLGTAGFSIEHEGYTVLIDPYLTRASLLRCARGGLVTDASLVATHTPKANAIVAGHTHFDHALDVPAIARHTGATVYGSTSCARLCRAAGVEAARVVDVESKTAREPVRARWDRLNCASSRARTRPSRSVACPFPATSQTARSFRSA